MISKQQLNHGKQLIDQMMIKQLLDQTINKQLLRKITIIKKLLNHKMTIE